MPSTYSPLLRFEKIAPGDQAGLWGDTTNQNIGTLIEQAIAGVSNVDLTSETGDYELTVKNGIVDQSRSAVINCIGAAAGTVNLVIPTSTKLYVIRNNCGQTIYVKTATQTPGYELASGESNLVFCNGAEALPGFVVAGADTTPVSGGGTGATSFTAGYLKSPGGTAQLTTSATVPAADISGQLGVANGGTGQASLTSGGLLIGNGTGAVATLTGGVNGYVPTWSSSSNTWVSTAPSASGVSSISGSGNISVSPTTGSPVVSITSSPSFSTVTASSYLVSPYHYIGSSPGSMYIQNNGGEMGFVVSGLQTAKVTSAGIGCTALVSTGDIYGAAVLNASGNSGILPDGSIRIGNSSTTIFYLSNALVMAVNGTFNFSFNQNGQAYKPGGGSWTDSSDARLKENVVPLTGALSKILSLNPVSFDWKYDRPNVPGVGFIAQEVQQVIPSAVNISLPNEDQKPFIDDDEVLDIGWKNDMTAYLVKAIQELKAELDAAKAEIAALKGAK